jgi:hypothetical protein
MEIVYTVAISLQSHTLNAEPFLSIGVIAGIPADASDHGDLNRAGGAPGGTRAARRHGRGAR